ncbi:MAG: hypothetical protein Q4B68_06575 [Bacteroidales bacterium]|nr:hypothetical protein [Bacteroidales bacterium]
MKRPFFILFLLCLLALVGCKEQMSNDVVVQNPHFTVAADSVVEGQWVARVVSPTHIVSNYAPADTVPFTRDGIVCFRLAFNGHDNELPAHSFHYAAMGRDTTVVAFAEGPRPAKPGNIDAKEWTLRVDLRHMRERLDADGFFATPTADTIYRDEFHGVWIAGNIPPMSWDFFDLAKNTQLRLHETDSAGIYEITLPLQVRPEPIPYFSEWKIDAVNPDYPTVSTSMPIIDALYNMSIHDVASSLKTEGGERMFPRRANHTRMSYPIMLALAYLNPREAMATLKSSVDGGIITHKRKRSIWPINTDDISWAMAAWEVYAVTGDKQWLKWAYEVVKRTVTEEYEINGDGFTGLVHGGAQFAFSKGQFYPAWMDYKDIYETSSLSNNVFFQRAFEILNDMGDELGIESEYGAMAQQLKENINAALWNEQKHHYFQYTYVYASPVQSPVIDNFAQAMSVLWNIATDDRAEDLMMHTPIHYYGVTATSPHYQSDDRVNLSEVVTPMVQAFWNLAAAKTDNETMLRYGLGAMYRAQALFCANKGGFNAFTGMPLGPVKGDMGSAAGNLAMVFRIYAGMTFLPNGIEFNPFVPVFLKGKKRIEGFKYRDAVLDITIEGTGNNIEQFLIDGKETNDNFFDARLQGRHALVIKLGTRRKTHQQVTLMSRNYAIPSMPVVEWGSGASRLLNFDPRQRYRMVINSQIRYGIADSLFTLRPEKAAFSVNALMGVGTHSSSYISQPHYVMKHSLLLPIRRFANAGTSLIAAPRAAHVVEMSQDRNPTIDIEVEVPAAGEYFIRILYANGLDHPYCPTLSLKANSHKQGTIVLPCRGENEWLNTGWSNFIKAELMRGRNVVTLQRIGHHDLTAPVLLHAIQIAKR